MTTLLRPEDLRRMAEEQHRQLLLDAEELEHKHEEELKRQHDAFLHRHLDPKVEDRFNHQVAEAAKRGDHDILVLRFPSDWCEDGGRAINNLSDDWPASLTGFARELYDSFDARLRPLGYRIRAQILDYPGGMPGDVGIFLGW
ncbi:hypothetical protein [Azospirillum rugosum]|uniref:Uncharacterized protein n=1 Tax=Azospirillum rugosum TaxID=416170 RepID=A0ABS4SGI2_9PROT|nr:hypothetical protein [Azospirillum rugosum]MBP2291666.1 hypothetical protein [Azospirillum rugosum]MDQ0524522.1 hypothetical protein [Azospirillum rugosum]